MASEHAYLDYILEQLSDADGISFRAMMGEFILYRFGAVFGGIYDNRLLVKNVPAARAILPQARPEEPYPGGRPMLLVEDVDDRELLCGLVRAMQDELPPVKKKKPSAG